MNTTPPHTDEDYRFDAHRELAALRRAIDRDHVSIVELLVWGLGVAIVLFGMHYTYGYWANPGNTGAAVPKPVGGAETTVWVGHLGAGGYALLQLPAEQPEVAKFRDGPLSTAYGEAVRSYWLGLYAFGDAPLELDVATATITVNGVALSGKPVPQAVPPALAVQLAGLTAPVSLGPGKATRVLLVFADHDPLAVTQLALSTPSGPVVLESARRKLEVLEEFNERPFREFFESAHAHAEPKK